MEGREALTRGIASGKEKNTCISVKENASRNCHIKPSLARSDFVFLPRHPFPCLRNLFDGNNNPFQPPLSHPLCFRKKASSSIFLFPTQSCTVSGKKNRQTVSRKIYGKYGGGKAVKRVETREPFLQKLSFGLGWGVLADNRMAMFFSRAWLLFGKYRYVREGEAEIWVRFFRLLSSDGRGRGWFVGSGTQKISGSTNDSPNIYFFLWQISLLSSFLKKTV